MKTKRLLALSAAVCLLLSLCACGRESAPDGSVDVDLTAMSSTMVYAEVVNMVFAPRDYIGKVVNMAGSLSVYHDDATGRDYFAVIIADATACCAQGIEFVLAGDRRYPEDYLPEGSFVTVCGTFETYIEDGREFCHLVDATMS